MSICAGVVLPTNKVSKIHCNSSETALTLPVLEHPFPESQVILCITEPSWLMHIFIIVVYVQVFFSTYNLATNTDTYLQYMHIPMNTCTYIQYMQIQAHTCNTGTYLQPGKTHETETSKLGCFAWKKCACTETVTYMHIPTNTSYLLIHHDAHTCNTFTYLQCNNLRKLIKYCLGSLLFD
jgi:hypothetical protein